MCRNLRSNELWVMLSSVMMVVVSSVGKRMEQMRPRSRLHRPVNQLPLLQTQLWKVLCFQGPFLKVVSEETESESTCPLLHPIRCGACPQMNTWTHKKGSVGLYQIIANRKSRRRHRGDMKRLPAPRPPDIWVPLVTKEPSRGEWTVQFPYLQPPPTSFSLSPPMRKNITLNMHCL